MKTLTLFAGAGGADFGLDDAGVEAVLAVEWDEDAAEACRQNGFPCVTGDVRDLALYADTGRVDLLWASFPCQDFSTAGSRAGAQGERNGWPWTVEVIDHLRTRGDGPTWLIAENVRGLTMHVGDCPTREGGEQDDPSSCPRCYLDRVIVPELEARFAWVEWRIINSADHGVPQSRRRIYIAAGPRPIEWPERTHSGEALTKAKWDTGEYWQHVQVGRVGDPSSREQRWLDELRQPGLFRAERPAFSLYPWQTVRQALGLTAPGVMTGSRNSEVNPAQERPTPVDEPCYPVGTKGNQYLEARVVGGGHNPNHSADAVRNLRDITDEPSTTIAAQLGGGAGNAGPFVNVKWRKGEHPGLMDCPSPAVSATEVKGTDGKESTGWTAVGGPARASDALWLATGRRRLEVEECVALMGWPDDAVTHGTKSARYRQAGNGCTPVVVERLARSVMNAEEER